MAAKIVIVGGGINGIAIARELAKIDLDLDIKILEKEDSLGSHASTRNSGVIHAGFYYDPDSKRGRFCSNANKMLREYCINSKIPLNKCGKVVVAKNEEELVALTDLNSRGKSNGAELQLINADQLNKFEPKAKTYKKFLWSPNTWSASPKHLLEALVSECKETGVEFITNVDIKEFALKKIICASGEIYSYDYLINSAGGYALEIAHKFGLATDYESLPFKGLYLKSQKRTTSFKTHIYPVPNPKQTFLGIHTTLTYDGYLKIGPTALPVLSPEHYNYLSNFTINDIFKIIPLHANLFALNSFGFRDLAIQELGYLRKRNIINSVNSLLKENLLPDEFDWHSPGIRAQLININSKELLTDFLAEETRTSMHLLNTISPSWTCALKTSEFIRERIFQILK